jgi:hypothetical protein
MILIFVLGFIQFIAQAVTALAETITVVCSLGAPAPNYYLKFDMAAKTVKDELLGATYELEVSDEEVRWRGPNNVIYVVNRITGQLISSNGNLVEIVPCRRHVIE